MSPARVGAAAGRGRQAICSISIAGAVASVTLRGNIGRASGVPGTRPSRDGQACADGADGGGEGEVPLGPGGARLVQ